MVAVLDATGVGTAHFLGYSMGGWIGFGMAKFAPDRIDALVIGGQHPFARDQASLRQMVREATSEGGDAFVTGMAKMFGQTSDRRAERLRTADLKAYLAMLQDRPDIGEMLETMAMPCCIYAGEADPIYALADGQASVFRMRASFHCPAFRTCRASARVEPCCRRSWRSLPLPYNGVRRLIA